MTDMKWRGMMVWNAFFKNLNFFSDDHYCCSCLCVLWVASKFPVIIFNLGIWNFEKVSIFLLFRSNYFLVPGSCTIIYSKWKLDLFIFHFRFKSILVNPIETNQKQQQQQKTKKKMNEIPVRMNEWDWKMCQKYSTSIHYSQNIYCRARTTRILFVHFSSRFFSFFSLLTQMIIVCVWVCVSCSMMVFCFVRFAFHYIHYHYHYEAKSIILCVKNEKKISALPFSCDTT